ncbi:hypothetical protein KSP40_PGU011731 [Platanthera guangdongensis]|uniref:VHS domain-containing protein n=1 Tax=Platanthera guangdongensis TaxID=2320717 RepID=A0ABR2M065_9ASPA
MPRRGCSLRDMGLEDALIAEESRRRRADMVPSMLSMPSSAAVSVEKATSHLLMVPDWTLNMDICDAINTDPLVYVVLIRFAFSSLGLFYWNSAAIRVVGTDDRMHTRRGRFSRGDSAGGIGEADGGSQPGRNSSSKQRGASGFGRVPTAEDCREPGEQMAAWEIEEEPPDLKGKGNPCDESQANVGGKAAGFHGVLQWRRRGGRNTRKVAE